MGGTATNDQLGDGHPKKTGKGGKRSGKGGKINDQHDQHDHNYCSLIYKLKNSNYFVVHEQSNF